MPQSSHRAAYGTIVAPVRVSALVPVLISLLLAGCGGDRPVAPPRAARVTVTAPVTTLRFGETAALVAAVLDANGRLLTGRAVTWGSGNDAVAAVSAAGVVTAGAVRGGTSETVTVTATSEGVSGTVALQVAPIPAAQVTLTPAALALQPGQAQPLAAALRDATGGALTGRTITWSSSAPAVATVSAQGVVTAVGAGTTHVTAQSDAARDSVPVTVTVPVASLTLSPDSLLLALGDTRPFTAVVRDAAGAVLAGRPVSWSSSAPAIATVAADGRVTGVAAGRALVIARSEARADTAPVTVVVPSARLVFDRVPAHVPPGFGVGIVVRATSTGSDTLAAFTGAVTLQGDGDAVPFLGTPTAVARGGVATFHDLAISAAGTYRLRATAPSLASSVSPPIAVATTSSLPTITVGTVTRTVVSTAFPGTSRYLLPVTLRDGGGQLVGPTPVSVAILRGAATLLAGQTTVTTVQGAATFDLTVRGAEALDLLLTAPGFQSRVQGVSSPTGSVSGMTVQRNTADSVVAVGGTARLSATLANRTGVPVHAVTYELSWNPAQLSLAADTVAVGTAPAINRAQLAEGVLRVTLAESAPLAAAGTDVLLHRLHLLVRPGASGEQRVRIVTLELRGPAGELLGPRTTAETLFRVP